MLFFFRGRNRHVARAVLGAILLVIGIVLPGGALLAGIGVVFLVWGGIGVLSSQRARRQEHVGIGGRMS
jgi:membrane-bound ClpP family serine protease